MGRLKRPSRPTNQLWWCIFWLGPLVMAVTKFLLLDVHYLPLDVHHVLEFDAHVLAMVAAPVLAIMGYLLTGLQTCQHFFLPRYHL